MIFCRYRQLGDSTGDLEGLSYSLLVSSLLSMCLYICWYPLFDLFSLFILYPLGMTILNRPAPPHAGFTHPVEVTGRLRVKKFALIPGVGRGRILTNPPRLYLPKCH